MTIPLKVQQRLTKGIKKYQKVLLGAKEKDVNESDTSLIITDMLSELFGYNKYSEITTETAIRGTYCDLAIVLGESIRLLLEVKAIGIDLKDAHIKQAIDYASNKGLDWVVLTNGVEWQIYRVIFSKPIEKELVAEFKFTELNAKTQSHLDQLFLVCKEGIQKQALAEYHAQKQTTSKHIIGNILATEDVVKIVRKKLKEIFPAAKVDLEEIKEAIEKHVCKREIFEGDEAEAAKKRILKALKKNTKKISIKPISKAEVVNKVA